MNYCICASGRLGAIVLGHLFNKSITINAVLTDSKSDEIISLSINHNIPCFMGNPRMGKAVKWLDDNLLTIEHLLSVNYLFILEEDLLNRVEGFAVNFHGSLLPKYRGRTPHVWAIINGEKEAGITAHLMNTLCDDGDIVKQIIVPIEEEDTGAVLLEKYNSLYPHLVSSIIEDIEGKSIQTVPQDSSKATCYSKRSPSDGLINWDWQKERIRNWVRAQAHPYPGAFGYLDGVKFTINRIEYSDLGYSDQMPNGLVLSISHEGPIVKVQNGAILLKDVVGNIAFTQNDILK